MRLWPQSAQRSTWPPRAAERHCSIADITRPAGTFAKARSRCRRYVQISRLFGWRSANFGVEISYRTTIVLHSSFFWSDSFALLGEYSGGANGRSLRGEGEPKTTNLLHRETADCRGPARLESE